MFNHRTDPAEEGHPQEEEGETAIGRRGRRGGSEEKEGGAGAGHDGRGSGWRRQAFRHEADHQEPGVEEEGFVDIICFCIIMCIYVWVKDKHFDMKQPIKNQQLKK